MQTPRSDSEAQREGSPKKSASLRSMLSSIRASFSSSPSSDCLSARAQPGLDGATSPSSLSNVSSVTSRSSSFSSTSTASRTSSAISDGDSQSSAQAEGGSEGEAEREQRTSKALPRGGKVANAPEIVITVAAA